MPNFDEPNGSDQQRALIERLAQECQRETSRYSRGEKDYDPQPCFEIWRLAIVERNPIAWEKLVNQYNGFVRRWLQQRLNSYPDLQGEEEILLNGVFFNFFRFVGPDKFDNFKNLPQLLQYLKMICGTVVADALRDRQGRSKSISLEAGLVFSDDSDDHNDFSPASRLASGENIEREAWKQDAHSAFYKELWQQLPDERDRLIVYLRFIQDIKPQEIVRLYPQFFATQKEVYQRTKNLVWRLGRNPRLKQLLDELLGES